MRYVLASIALVVSGFAVYAAAADQLPPGAYTVVTGADSEGQEIADLNERIGKLQAELDGLKERLKALQNNRKRRALTVPNPVPRPLVKPIPPDWHRREFNGQEYFIIPLAKDPLAGKD